MNFTRNAIIEVDLEGYSKKEILNKLRTFFHSLIPNSSIIKLIVNSEQIIFIEYDGHYISKNIINDVEEFLNKPSADLIEIDDIMY